MLKVILISLAFSAAFAGSDKCRVLAFSGGSDKGPYQVGALKGLVESMPALESQYDVITGVSVGAINALPLARFPKGQESAAVTFLTNFWTQFKSSEFYSDWLGGYVEGLFWQTGLYNSQAMLDTITNKLFPNSKFERKLVVGSTNLKDATFVVFTSDLSDDKVATGVYASNSMHGMFPVVKYSNYVLTDGTVKFGADLISGVTYCQDQGFADSDIIVDVIMDTHKTLQKVDASKFNTLQSLQRYQQITGYEGVMKSVTNAQHFYPDVNIRHVVQPSEDINSFLQVFPFDFDADEVNDWIALGEKDAKALVNSKKSRTSYQQFGQS